MALVLRASVPSGIQAIVDIRTQITALMPFRDLPVTGYLPRPWVRHVFESLHEYPSSRMYIGFGMTDCQGRPSQWANPYFYLDYDYLSAYNLFSDYMKARADLREWLYPLRNCELICDCQRGEFCHGNLLIEAFEECFDFDPEDADADMKLDAMDAACVLEGFEEDDNDEDDIAPAPKFNPDIEAINETVRSGAARLHEERPSWLPSWLRLIMIIRTAPHPVFWEMFAGKAGLTREFLRQGWPCGPPVDIVYNPDFDLLNPLFLSVVLGLIFERLVRILHLGPPCSSFSMAVNRFKSYAMRSADQPEGFDDLPPHREEKVRLGNALAEVASRLAEAQEKAGNFWTLEQPTTSLMWLYAPIAALIAKVTTFLVIIDVCMFGAPWRKPTTLAANFREITQLYRRCDGSHDHISLQGNAPCGRSWTAVASPYWPEFARAWVAVCACLFVWMKRPGPPLVFAGFASVPADVDVHAVLEEMDFQLPKGQERLTTATRVGAGIQPTGRSMPQLLPDGLGPKDHVTVALATTHPLARPPAVPSWCLKAIDAQERLWGSLRKTRSSVIDLLVALASLCTALCGLIVDNVHEWIRPIVARRNVAFMTEVTFICGGLDTNLMVDYVFGLPMMGWARHSPTMVQRTTRPPRAVRPSEDEVLAHNEVVLERAKPSKDQEADKLSWDKSKAEFKSSTMLGPYYEFDEIPRTHRGTPRLLNRFGILERHGGATEASVRNIDDAKARGHNDESANTATHRPADLDLLASISRRVAERFPNCPMAGFPSDFKSAYRQVTADPNQAQDFAVVSWDTDRNCRVFMLAVTQLFGSGNAPLNFTRFPEFCCRALAALFAIPAVHCVDDVIVIELASLIDLGFSSWRRFADLCGWDVPDSKSPPPTQLFRALGAMMDFESYPRGPICIRPAEDRVTELLDVLQRILTDRALAPALAGKIYGKLMFLSSQYFGRLGRALLRAFSRRQHELSRFALNPQIEAAVNFWIAHMRCLRPREIPVSLIDSPVFLSYSDGEGEGAGVGVALWCPDGSIVGGYIVVPQEARETWSRAATAGDFYDIFEIEAIGPALVLHNFEHLFTPNALWIHYIDNDAALATLVKGSSSVLSGEVITAYTHSRVAAIGLWPWFDRVASEDNPVDKLSRGKMDGPWKLVEIAFPPILLRDLRSYLNK